MSEESYAASKWGEDNSGNYITDEEKRVVDMAVTAASVESGIPAPQIIGRIRREPIVDARFITYTICYESGIFSYNQLGKCLGKDHGTIMWGLDRTMERLNEKGQSYKKFRELYARTKRRYKEYASNPERMVQELSVHDG